MIKAIALDDEPLALEVLSAYCEETHEIELKGAFTQSVEALNYLEKHPVDLIFLDIEMPAISGIDFFKGLQHDLMVIFTTAYVEYAIEGFELDAIDYLLKPIEQSRFKKAIHKALDYYQYKKGLSTSTLFIKADYSVKKVDTQDIWYIEGMADYLRIHLKQEKPVVARMTMKEIINRLPDDFIRVHRSFIVPLSGVNQYRNRKLTLGSVEVPVGKTYIELIQQRFGQGKP